MQRELWVEKKFPVKPFLSSNELLYNENVTIHTYSFHACVPSQETFHQRCSYKKVFWKNAANLKENTHAEARCE